MLPFTTMLVRLSLAPLEIARAYCEAFSSGESIGMPRVATSRVDPYKPAMSAAAKYTSSENRAPSGQSTNQAKAMSTQFYDNQVATVNYQILFTKRDSEAILAKYTTTVAKAMTGSGFASWKIAQFVSDQGGFERPQEWTDQDVATHTTGTSPHLLLKPEFYEFLQVEYQVLSVLDRKAPADHKIAALLDIANAIKRK